MLYKGLFLFARHNLYNLLFLVERMEKEIEKSDVLVIGSGGAGLRCAIELADSKVDVLVVGKCKKRDAHTIMATGGINAALGNMDPQDNWRIHAADTIRDGGYINDMRGVMLLCKNAPDAVKELADWGTHFHREKDGRITQRFFGAASYRRACFAGDHTGRDILNTLVDQVEKRKIRSRSEVYIFSLLQRRGRVNGAIGIDLLYGRIIVFHAKIVVLCAGGHSRVFTRSSSRFWENTGDGVGLAYGVGARCMDMEMFQFHPTGMVYPAEAGGVLVTEAVRGEGGILLNSRGERFMRKYDPERLELSARDIVARAIYQEIEEGRGTRHGGVWLDIAHKPKSYILKRLPKMYQQFKKSAGIDISKESMEVAPTAHYSMGGILVDFLTGKTSVPRLFAIGEVTGGMHGANRLGGNSLAEIIVFGRFTGKDIAKEIKKIKYTPLDEELILEKKQALLDMLSIKRGKNPIEVKKEIQKMMWKDVGVVRDGKEMRKALHELEKFKKIPLVVGDSLKMNEKLIAALDIKHMLPTCEMIIKSALFRKESRGAHYRSDYPFPLEKWRKNILCIPSPRGIMLITQRVAPIPKKIQKFLKMKPKAHLLE